MANPYEPVELRELFPGDRFCREDRREILLLLEARVGQPNAACLETGHVYTIVPDTPVYNLARTAPGSPREALKRLLQFRPGIKPSDVAVITGWPVEDAAQSDGIWFLSESFLYPLMGKDDARTLLARLNAVCETLGFDLHALEMELAREENEGE